MICFDNNFDLFLVKAHERGLFACYVTLHEK